MIWYAAQTSKMAGELTITVCEISAPISIPLGMDLRMAHDGKPENRNHI